MTSSLLRFVGVGARRVRSLFQAAKKKVFTLVLSTCIFLILAPLTFSLCLWFMDQSVTFFDYPILFEYAVEDMLLPHCFSQLNSFHIRVNIDSSFAAIAKVIVPSRNISYLGSYWSCFLYLDHIYKNC
jgi:hypothetical protein